MTAERIYTVAGTGVCGTTGQGGPCRRRSYGTRWPSPSTAPATCSWPTAATSRCFWRRRAPGPTTGPRSAPATSASSWGGRGATGRISPTVSPPPGRRPSSTTPAAWPSARPARSSSPTASCRSSESCQSTTGMLFGRAMTAGTSTRWPEPCRSRPPRDPGTARVGAHPDGDPVGLAVSSSGALSYSDARLDTVRVIGARH